MNSFLHGSLNNAPHDSTLNSLNSSFNAVNSVNSVNQCSGRQVKKIGIISDTHGSLTTWKTVYQNFFKSADLILHCGDVLYHGPRNPLPVGYNPAELARDLNALTTPLVIVKGNCDAEVDQMVLDYPMEVYFRLFLGDLRILVQHGHAPYLPAKVEKGFNLLISGHTHLPVIKKEDGLIRLNPGSPSLPKDDEKTPTIALIEENQISLWNIESKEKIETVVFK